MIELLSRRFPQGSHRLEKHLKMKGTLEKSVKTKFALKSAWKLSIDLEIYLIFTFICVPDRFSLYLCSRQRTVTYVISKKYQILIHRLQILLNNSAILISQIHVCEKNYIN